MVILGYSKQCNISLVNADEDLEDKVLIDIKDREKERIRSEDDFLEELKIYDLTIITDYVKKMGKKILGLLVNKASSNYSKNVDEFDYRLLDGRVPPCFHVNYIMSHDNPVSNFKLS